MISLAVVEAHAELDDKVQATRRVGRYALFGEIASGGMATVYFGRLVGAVGFSRSVAIKQLHPQFARSPEFVAREGELFVIMEFVEGEPLSRLVRFARDPIPLTIASAIVTQVLLGLHAA